MVKRHKLLLGILIVGIFLLLGGVGTYAATLLNKSMGASVNIVPNANFSFFSDQAATQSVTQVSLPDVLPGGTSTFTVYVKNTGQASETISEGTNTVPLSIGTLTMTFDGQNQKLLAVNAVSRVLGTLRVADSATAGSLNFTFSVNASTNTTPTTTTTTPVTTTTTSTSTSTTPVLDGRQIFNANCTSCHGTPNTSLSQSQLQTFISSHYTGRNLTAAEVAAIASFLKP